MDRCCPKASGSWSFWVWYRGFGNAGACLVREVCFVPLRFLSSCSSRSTHARRRGSAARRQTARGRCPAPPRASPRKLGKTCLCGQHALAARRSFPAPFLSPFAEVTAMSSGVGRRALQASVGYSRFRRPQLPSRDFQGQGDQGQQGHKGSQRRGPRCPLFLLCFALLCSSFAKLALGKQSTLGAASYGHMVLCPARPKFDNTGHPCCSSHISAQISAIGHLGSWTEFIGPALLPIYSWHSTPQPRPEPCPYGKHGLSAKRGKGKGHRECGELKVVWARSAAPNQ